MTNGKLHLRRTAVFFLFLFLLIVGPIRAEERNMAAEFLNERAQLFYERGQRKEAMHEFSKVLLIDPANPTAFEYLKKLGVDRGLYRPFKTVSVRHRDAPGNVYSSHPQKFDQSNTAIPTKNQEGVDYSGLLAMKDQKIFHLKDTLSRTLQLQKEATEESDKKVEALEEKKVEHQDDLKQLIKARDQDIAGLKQDLALMKKNMISIPKVTPAAADDTPSEMSDLQSAIRNIQLELTEKEMSLKEKEKALTELQKELDEALERNDLSQKIIQEKDTQIKKLVEDLQNPSKPIKKLP